MLRRHCEMGVWVDIYHIWFNLKPGIGDTELGDRWAPIWATSRSKG
jgi:hypothetical protein